RVSRHLPHDLETPCALLSAVCAPCAPISRTLLLLGGLSAPPPFIVNSPLLLCSGLTLQRCATVTREQRQRKSTRFCMRNFERTISRRACSTIVSCVPISVHLLPI